MGTFGISYRKGKEYAPRVKLICQKCGKEFIIYKSRLRHGKIKYCSSKCYFKNKVDIGNSSRKRKNCEFCNKEFQICSSNSKQRFCSQSCAGKDKSTILPLKSKLIKMYNEGLSTIEIGKRLAISHRLIWKNLRKWIKLRTHSETQKSLWKDDNYANKMRPKLMRSSGKHPNKIEKDCIKLFQIKNIQLTYVGDGTKWFKSKNGNRFNPDFINEDKKIIVEIFGDYWHRNTQERDKLRINTYKKNGYEPLIIWEKELLNQQEILNKIWGLENWE